MVGLRSLLPERLVGRQQFLPVVGRVAADDIEAALGEDFGEGGLPIKCLGMDRRVVDDAVALADGVVEAGQQFAAGGGLDPEAELSDLDGLPVQVHAVEIVLQDLTIEVEEGALQGQGFGGEGGRAEKLKLGKLKAEIATQRARRSAAAFCRGCAWKAMAPNAPTGWLVVGGVAPPRWRPSCP